MSRSTSLGAVKEVRLSQGTVRYRERGSGEPIVFVHGLMVNGDLWRKVVPELSPRFRCLTPDLPLGSHELALSPEADLSPPGLARLIADFTTALGLDGVTLVGNDTGGALCQLVVAEHPERVSRLVLTSCDAYENFLPPFFRYLQWNAYLPGGTFLLAQTLRLRPLRRLPIAFGWLAKRAIEREAMDSYCQPAAGDASIRRDLGKVLRGISPRYTLAAAERFAGFRQPVLIAWAADDRFFPVAHAERLARTFPRARLELIADSYTFVSEDQPQRLAELIGAFAAGPAALSA
jgi:pimeloyl-ACP methyl ester carboxylesterase